jgi:hypothetical protein
MRMTWIGGWGIAPESMRPLAEKYFAGSQHTFLPPTKQAIEEISRPHPHLSSPLSPSEGERVGVRSSPDIMVAWSFGAWRLLEAAARGVEFPGMVLLYAPFVAFPSEAGLGGKCSATQVKFLRRWLQREPLSALADFCKRAEIPVSNLHSNTPLPYALSDLLEGLERLSEDASPGLREFAARGLPRNWQAFVGDRDPLLDGATVCRSLPGCVLLRGVGHAIADLLAASQAK